MKFIQSFSVLIFLFLRACFGFAHPMPNTIVVLEIGDTNIRGEIQLPLSELQSAVGMNVNDHSQRLIERLGDTLKIYFLKHIRPKTLEGKSWTVELGDIEVVEANDKLVGIYKELVVRFMMTPPEHYDLRNFYFDYDVILHQVASHKALISIKQDWKQGIVHEDSSIQQIGVIEWDVVNGKLTPFQISLQQGSVWQGFKSMVRLGMKHIADGTDHILFVLTLLLVPRLGGVRGLIELITAFTIGHSISLLFGSLGWVNFPPQPIEILIAISILLSAVHAIRPIFQGKEIYVVAVFGLIHGLAFANTLIDLNLSNAHFLLSIFGFNVGIELFQLLIMLLTMPVLWVISTKTAKYGLFRNIIATICVIASVYWLFERISD